MSFTQKKILILDSVDSTNNYAMALIQSGTATDGSAVFTREQNNGKGRRSKQWDSNKNDNIILSVAVQMQWLPVSQQFGLSIAAALGCYDLMSKHIPGKVFIKWPNDIFINDTKAGGILIENVIRGTLWQWAVIGIGLNINQQEFKDFDYKATSLMLAIEKKMDVLQLAEELYTNVLKRIDDLKNTGFENMLKEYNEKLFAKNKLVKLRKETVVFETRVKGVSSNGQLITEDDLERRFNFDEVKFEGFV